MDNFALPFIVCVISFFALNRLFPQKRIIVALFALVFGAAIFFFAENRDEPPDEAAKVHIARQQEIVAEWHFDYQRYIDEMDRNWRNYHRILSDFDADIIGIEVTHERLLALASEAAATEAAISKMAPPPELDEENHTLVAKVMSKTRAYAKDQRRTIELTAGAADPERLLSPQQEEQSRRLRDVMNTESPAGLFTAKEIMALRENVSER